MFDFCERTTALLGEKAVKKLETSTVCIIGVGGVGGAVAEALVRCGVGKLIIVDHDDIDISNVNRQLFATSDTVGTKKVISARSRLLSINPKLDITTLPIFYNDDTKEQVFSCKPNYIADCIDTVSSKLNLVSECQARNVPIISSLGTGNRLDPTRFLIGKIEDTSGCGCGLARVMRRECRARKLTDLTVLYSTEIPKNVITSSENGRHSPASVSFCPPVAGYIIASHIVSELISE